jgi:UDP-N-acetylmuramoyl-L-alanyl-D-glutamate--2,6-diaminopimelate ligase
MRLREILKEINYQLIGNAEALEFEINEIVFDSRKANTDAVFVAIKGTQVDGHRFIRQTIEAGVKVVVCEQLEEAVNGVAYIKVESSSKALGLMAANFYEHPSKEVVLVGVTGTNGKTSTATLLYKLFMSLGQKSGLISTVENRIGEEVETATHTTPDALSIQQTLVKMRDAACEYVFMEVSSHAADQERIAGLDFDGAIFTNMSRDHLDYHGTFKNYIYAKKKFFDQLPEKAFALVNVDDKQGMVMVQNTKAKVKRYAMRSLADFKVKIVENSLTGLVLEIDGLEVHTRLVGDFNAYNFLAVYAAAILLGEAEDEVLTALSQLSSAEGRFDYVMVANAPFMGIVDYAHTPDALEKVLKTLQEVCQNGERIITVVGCGGDRDKGKRPIMAKAACDYSHQVILTSDNPRTEDPEAILRDMEQGIPANAAGRVLTITNRLQAIKAACRFAQKGDVVLVAGKGHEKYQEINGVKHPFDDKAVLQAAIAELI